MATSVQTTYGAPAVAIAGMLADDGPRDVGSANNSSATALPVAVVALRSGDRLCRPILSTDEPTADPDAIIASGVASATTRQTITGATLNGIIGVAEISPPKNLTLTFNSHADWNDTILVIQGLDWAGRPIEETFNVKEGGNEVLTGVMHFSFVTAVIIPPGTSTNGSLLVGTGSSIGPINKLFAGITMYDLAREPGQFSQYEKVSLLKEGRLQVTAEAAVTAGQPVFVRFVAGVGEVRGAMRGAADSTDCGLLVGARWATTTTDAGLAIVEVI